jgi:hypothetical protein
MTEESRLLDLVARWEAARDSGNPIKPEELCAGCPEMLPALRSALIRLHGSNAVDGGSLPFSVVTRAFERISKPTTDPPADGGYRIGEEVAGFRLLRQIGQGGFGQVFEAEDPVLKRPVAIKFLLPQAYARPGIQELFLSEARSMAAIQHDHVVPIFQVGQVDSNLFDDYSGHASSDGPFLFCLVNGADATLAQLLMRLVRTNHRAEAFVLGL